MECVSSAIGEGGRKEIKAILSETYGSHPNEGTVHRIPHVLIGLLAAYSAPLES